MEKALIRATEDVSQVAGIRVDADFLTREFILRHYP
jgi:hypothetical protein